MVLVGSPSDAGMAGNDPATAAGEGRFAPVERIDQINQWVPLGQLKLVQQTSRDLWNVWLAVVVLSVLLLAEWVGRKKYNMV